MAEKDIEFKKALVNSDILLPDGVGITAALKILQGQSVKKIAGADIHQHLLEKLNKEGGKCFYLGSKQSTLDAIRERLNNEYPNIKVGLYSPPFKPRFTDEENSEMVQTVNAFKPDVLFVGMTAPKQEKWSYLHKDQLDTKVICPIGAVFDFYAETIKRPSQFWISLGLEWFIRLIKEPKRMAKRYLYYGPVFVWELVKVKITGGRQVN
jgi:N-acetylglucosaminyldiphosphoundecaprenol N-acetyl-beta-D-mannosaminyltransferase